MAIKAAKVGKITHYYDRLGVAVIKLDKTLRVGDQVKISGHGEEFSQTVDSMQMEHESIKSAKKGQSIGLKVNQPVKDGTDIYLVK